MSLTLEVCPMAIHESRPDGIVGPWPDPPIQLNPSFAPGDTTDTLIDQGILHEGCRHSFRLKTEDDPAGQSMRLHRHQSEAVKVAYGGGSYVADSYWFYVVWDPLSNLGPEPLRIRNPVKHLDHAKKEAIAARYFDIPAQATEDAATRGEGTVA